MPAGGKRINSGRKPVNDKKVQISLYVRESLITKFGKDILRSKLYKLIEKL